MDEVKNLYANYGNPGGGMVHSDLPKKDAPAAKKEEVKKESKLSAYMKKVGVLAAAFANPRGGMVHHDMPKETSKVAEELLGASKKKDAQKSAAVAAALASRRGR